MFSRISKYAVTTVIAALCFGTAGDAQANMFVYKDPAFKYSFAFPDTWRQQTGDDDNVRIRIAAPVESDLATCRIKADKDGRLKIYPKRHMEAANNATLTADFWDREANEFNNAEIIDMWGSAGLGQGDATGVRVTYDQDGPFGMAKMTALIISTIYGDDRFTMSCASRSGVFDRYSPLFGNIMNTVKMDERYTMFPGGYYSNFVDDPQKFYIPNYKPGTHQRASNSSWNPFGDTIRYRTTYGPFKSYND